MRSASVPASVSATTSDRVSIPTTLTGFGVDISTIEQ